MAPVWWTSAGFLAIRASRATRLLTSSLRQAPKEERYSMKAWLPLRTQGGLLRGRRVRISRHGGPRTSQSLMQTTGWGSLSSLTTN
ncbi:hypothetical protein SMAC4_13584 [Sordaria macrospora]|uniref:uncharacterized protein n=1 Tax=Sordaria macrospora TaxID=5147 RepID=UPI002B29BA6E|nr:hypothetical protein SMAC4_13584 [Sordaria macrospora]